MFIVRAKEQFYPDRFPIAIERNSPEDKTKLASRDFCKIVIIVGGHGVWTSAGSACHVTEGDVFVLGRHNMHASGDAKNLRLIKILFRPEKLHLELLDLSRLAGYQALFSFGSSRRQRHSRQADLHLVPKELSIALNYAETLAHELEVRSPGFAFIASACFMQLVGYLSRAYCGFQRTDQRARSSVGNAIEHLEAHYGQPIDLDELSRLTHMSKRSFFRAFQAATGHTPHAYLANLRLTRAAAMLRRQEENVTSVALKVGYNDSNYFTRRFHATFGLPPSEYRKRQEPL